MSLVGRSVLYADPEQDISTTTGQTGTLQCMLSCITVLLPNSESRSYATHLPAVMYDVHSEPSPEERHGRPRW